MLKPKFLFCNELKKIGLNILSKRREMNLTQKELGIAAGISASKVSSIEQGKTDYTFKALLLIADALKVDYHELVK